ncbi:MAG: autotransporter domain-containing protein, partial [Verrucomicrobiota bacterium]
ASHTLTAATYALNGGSIINANLGSGSVTTNGTVALNGTSGAATFHVQTGTTTLGAAERLLDSSAVTIDAPGTLKLGGDEKIGTLAGAGNLQNSGFRLTLDGGNFSGVISGSGGLTKVSGGTLVLSGANTYTGTTLVSSGGLEISGSLTSSSINTTNGATLTVDTGSSITADVLTVLGTLTVTDSSTLNYTTLTGSGVINNTGHVFVNRAGSTIKGFLTFTGDYSNLGTFAPGNSPGLITIGGNYSEAGTFQAELETTTPITGHDQVRVGGSATLLPSSSLIVQTYNNVLPVRGNIYQVIANSTGGIKPVTGTFGAVTFDADGASGPGLPVVNAAVLFDQATGRVITTGLNKATSTFADLGATPNQRRAAGALFATATGLVGPNQINTTNSAGSLALQLVTAHGNFAGNLACFTPEFYGALSDYALANDLSVTNLLHDRVGALTNMPGTSADGFDLYSGMMQQHLNAAGQTAVNRTDSYVGGDYTVSKDLSVGLLATYDNGDLSATYGRGDVDGMGGNAYFKTNLNPLFSLVGRAGYESYHYSMHRFTTDTVLAYGDTHSDVYTGSLGVDYVGWTWGNLSLAPRADVTYSHASVNGFTETGANDRLALGGFSAERLAAQLGGSLIWTTKLAGHPLSVEVNAGIEQLLIDNKDNQRATVVASPSTSFSQTFTDNALTSASYGLRVGYGVTNNASIYAGYEGRISADSSGSANLGLRVGF